MLTASLQKARAALFGMLSRCRAVGMYNVMVQCNLFNALVASVLNYSCPIWGVYHTHSMQQHRWVGNVDAENLQHMFLRMAFQVPKSTTIAVLMNEARREPLSHAWVEQAVGFYNKVVRRAADDLVKIAMRESMRLGVDGTDCDACWGAAFRRTISSVQPDLQQSVQSMVALPLPGVMHMLHSKWHACVWGEWAEWSADVPSPREFQPSDGFKMVTYRTWFCHGYVHDDEPARCPMHARHGFAHHLNRPEHVRVVARFRMRAHALNIERHGIARAARVCQCCVGADGRHSCIEDEMHVLECPAYEQLRQQFLDVLGAARMPVTDADMHTVMNPTDPSQWRRLALFLLKVFEIRNMCADADLADADFQLHDQNVIARVCPLEQSQPRQGLDRPAALYLLLWVFVLLLVVAAGGAAVGLGCGFAAASSF